MLYWPEMVTLAKTASAQGVAAIERALQDYGVDGRELTRSMGIQHEVVVSPRARISEATLDGLLTRAIEVTGDPAFGLTLSRYFMLITGPLFQALMSSETLLEAVGRLSRYQRIFSERFQLRPAHDADRMILSIGDSVGAKNFHPACDAIVAACVSAIRLLTGDPSTNPMSVELRRPEPECIDRYHEYLGREIRFSAPNNLLIYDRVIGERRLPSANVKLARETDRVLDEYLCSLAGAVLTDRVRQAIIESFPDGSPNKQAVARKLGMSPRNLHRYLAAEGDSFRGLVDEVRYHLARQYLDDGSLGMIDIAYLLGFSETSSFCRAFRRWAGVSPSAFVSTT